MSILSVYLSYAFVYFVLFLVVPFVVVTFVLTCIKFFRHENEVPLHARIKNRLFDNESLGFFKSLKSLTKGQYEICSHVPLDSVVEVERDEAEPHGYLDYVLIDQNSSEIKMIISDFSDVDNASVLPLLRKMNIRIIDMKRDHPFDTQHLSQALAA
ncbi:hypothetical protein HR45_09370 [Shewanella mangrovi]|uniref:DUF2726 domain-containing protein n=1 Tax=Shewanella mangrovi TaxID=1515746 RepID=A0A094LR12_9GAMM|nr:hypothetical protein [Shewanella mangrovi]KFZ37623.1 hypothetical protein HR45_09370 [Shewanella mangrovi]